MQKDVCSSNKRNTINSSDYPLSFTSCCLMFISLESFSWSLDLKIFLKHTVWVDKRQVRPYPADK